MRGKLGLCAVAEEASATSSTSAWTQAMPPPPPLAFPQMAQQRVMPIMGQSGAGPYHMPYPMWLPNNMVPGITRPMSAVPAGTLPTRLVCACITWKNQALPSAFTGSRSGVLDFSKLCDAYI